MSIVVSDTSPIRALAHLGHIDLLHGLFGEVLVPPAVATELEKPRSRFHSISLQGLIFVRIQAPLNRTAVAELQVTLGPGTAEALVLAVEVRADAILIDESAGRAEALRRGLAPLGVLGILLRAKERGMVELLRPLLDRLQNELGFFVAPELGIAVVKKPGQQLDRKAKTDKQNVPLCTSEAHPELAGDLALQDVAEDVILNRRIGQVGNLQHRHVLSADDPAEVVG